MQEDEARRKMEIDVTKQVPGYNRISLSIIIASDHISTVTSKAAKRLWFLKKLKRAGVSQEDLVYYYQAVNYSTCA